MRRSAYKKTPRPMLGEGWSEAEGWGKQQAGMTYLRCFVILSKAKNLLQRAKPLLPDSV